MLRQRAIGLQEERERRVSLGLYVMITECNFRVGVDFHCDAASDYIRHFHLYISFSLCPSPFLFLPLFLLLPLIFLHFLPLPLLFLSLSLFYLFALFCVAFFSFLSFCLPLIFLSFIFFYYSYFSHSPLSFSLCFLPVCWVAYLYVCIFLLSLDLCVCSAVILKCAKNASIIYCQFALLIQMPAFAPPSPPC